MCLNLEKQTLTKAESLAREVLVLSRNTLLVHLRFLDAALSQFVLIPCDFSTIMTDSKYIAYNPKHVLSAFKKQKETAVRDYLHMVLHCIYRHMFMNPSLNRELWNLSCDIAVENIITELGLSATKTDKETTQIQYINQLKNDVSMITAEKLYNYFSSDPKAFAKARQMFEVFCADDHTIWYMSEEQKQQQFGNCEGEGEGESDGNGESNRNSDGDKDSNQDNSQNSGGNQGNSENDSSDMASSFSTIQNELWKEISEKIQVDIETFSREKGDTAGNLMQNLREVNREKYDYTEFLKKFAVMNETMKINDDEFDYIFYTYGLQLYDKMPLIEPLEYKDIKQIKEFVIAIDTSGSTSGDLAHTFLQKTFNILKSTESFAKRINLHIIQCDAQIQEHVKITTQDEFDEYLKTMKLRGFGGTDFRPVFEFTQKLIDEKEFTNLKGLLYFTDGYGTFPEKKPVYDTAFVFIDDNYNNYDVPPWAIKLVLQKDEI